MKLRSFYLSAALALFLASCGGTRSITAEPIALTKPIVAKKAALTDNQEQRWSHLDLVKDTIPGMSVDRAYEILKGKTAKKIIVGVIDSGVDIEHPDLAPVIWTNPKEIAGNGKDDDNNGYVDDIHGWNFLGDAYNENLELVRIIKKGDDGSATYKRAKAEFDKEIRETKAEKQKIDFIADVDKMFQQGIGKKDYTLEDLKAYNPKDPRLAEVKPYFIDIFTEVSREEFNEEILGAQKHFEDAMNYNLNLKFDGRKIVGDNPDDINNRNYGNNNVIGPDRDSALHGTHVAGIIAQVRNNGLGGDGVAGNNVEIMALRAVSNGDEYDKDIALAIRYAVDNGAKVINGSFGKYYSPHSEWVYDAIKYAAEKDVLIVFAAGNESKDLNAGTIERYPNDDRLSGTEFADNVLTVGAINYPFNEKLLADFSNYGKNDVDVYAPGVRIYATIPENKYKFEQGTSMASPNAAGVAALIRAYYPGLTAPQVKRILMDSGLPVSFDVILSKESPEEADKTRSFKELSRSGRIVNAYNAIIMADKMAPKK
jgi:subtilisin family serine protease